MAARGQIIKAFCAMLYPGARREPQEGFGHVIVQTTLALYWGWRGQHNGRVTGSKAGAERTADVESLKQEQGCPRKSNKCSVSEDQCMRRRGIREIREETRDQVM